MDRYLWSKEGRISLALPWLVHGVMIVCICREVSCICLSDGWMGGIRLGLSWGSRPYMPIATALHHVLYSARYESFAIEACFFISSLLLN